LGHLNIYDRRERALVTAADAVLSVAGPLARFGRRRARGDIERILLLRLERIGDLLMTLDAIQDVAAAAPHAEIDLVVGRWNEALASAIPGVRRVWIVDAPWLARGQESARLTAMVRKARMWPRRRYDLAINFEPDIRTNMLLAASRASRLAGFSSGGGGALLDVALPFDTHAHTSTNAERLVAAVLDVPPRAARPGLNLTAESRRIAGEILARHRDRPLAGVHVSGGRPIKQWAPEKFVHVARRLHREVGASIVLTGTPDDDVLIRLVRGALPRDAVIDLSRESDLVQTAAVIARLGVFVTGDTGPMHLAAAVGTPTVAIFGPSDPIRYGPPGDLQTVVRLDLPCSPCNRIRLPPARCRGHEPDCLAGIDADRVFRAAAAVLSRARAHHDRPSARGAEAD
jgi:ADP-heptose:LPS heptosyltransferase